MNCLLKAWDAHEPELRGWLRQRLGEPDTVDDLLQELFIKAMRQRGQFCAIQNPRSWFFQVARNALIDRHRAARDQVALPADLADTLADPNTDALLAPADQLPHDADLALTGLEHCLPRVLAELAETDRRALTRCDLEGATQQQLADELGLSLPGAKSRLQRARARLRTRLIADCQVRFDDSGRVCCFSPRPSRC